MLQISDNYINEIVSKQLKKILSENRVVTFNGKTYPNNGWCVILSGGSGSGKGFVLSTLLPINGKIINVDTYKKYFVKMRNGIIHGEKYDPKNTEHVSYVHNKVRDGMWKDKMLDNLMNPQTHSKNNLPNIIVDMTGRDPQYTVIEIVEQAKSVGYNTMLVWVVSNRHESIIRNLQRERRVSDVILHKIHNSLLRDMPPFLDSAYATYYLDDAWIVFGSTEDIRKPDFDDEEKKKAVVRLTKTNSGFKMDEETKDRLYRYLGKLEKNPYEPTTYVRSDNILQKYGKEVTQNVTEPNWTDLTKPRTKQIKSTVIDRSKLPKDLLWRGKKYYH